MNATGTGEPGNYRPAVRALVLAATAVAIRGFEFGVILAGQLDLPRIMFWAPIANVLTGVIAVLGIGYAAIAFHREGWRALPVAAWILSLLVILFPLVPFAWTQ